MHYMVGTFIDPSLASGRGPKGTYQAWADQAGDESYTWHNLLPYLKGETKLAP